jgi:hypothetical protein
MREIKFRAWKKSEQEMKIKFDINQILCSEDFLTEEEYKDLEIMQYT